VDVLVVVGERAAPLAQGAREAGLEAVHLFDGPPETAAFLAAELRADDWLLVKASRGIGLDRLVDTLADQLGS
jgi:UDP-N-acetylmuramoyl-tripeptide--D-alanyl-D-alanine ligase